MRKLYNSPYNFRLKRRVNVQAPLDSFVRFFRTVRSHEFDHDGRGLARSATATIELRSALVSPVADSHYTNQ